MKTVIMLLVLVLVVGCGRVDVKPMKAESEASANGKAADKAAPEGVKLPPQESVKVQLGILGDFDKAHVELRIARAGGLVTDFDREGYSARKLEREMLMANRMVLVLYARYLPDNPIIKYLTRKPPTSFYEEELISRLLDSYTWYKPKEEAISELTKKVTQLSKAELLAMEKE